MEIDETQRKRYFKRRKGRIIRTILLTRGYYSLVDDADFEFINSFKWFAVISVTGPNGFHVSACRWAKGESPRRVIRMSYAVLGIKSIKSTKLIDHINRNSLDNRKINLRITNKSTNGYNSNRSINASFVYFERSRNRWKSWIPNRPRNAKSYLGTFKTKEEAEAAVAAWRENVLTPRVLQSQELAP
jgi:hypothetical protein